MAISINWSRGCIEGMSAEGLLGIAMQRTNKMMNLIMEFFEGEGEERQRYQRDAFCGGIAFDGPRCARAGHGTGGTAINDEKKDA